MNIQKNEKKYLWLTYDNKEFRINVTHKFINMPSINFCTDGLYNENDIISVEKKLKDLLYETYSVYTCEEALKQNANS